MQSLDVVLILVLGGSRIVFNFKLNELKLLLKLNKNKSWGRMTLWEANLLK